MLLPCSFKHPIIQADHAAKLSHASLAPLLHWSPHLQVSSTETGVIFGNIVYEGSGYAERSVVVLNDIHIDIMDYISPAVCADVQFRNMWAEFEWENKVRRGRE
jgi:hypothetical protein